MAPRRSVREGAVQRWEYRVLWVWPDQGTLSARDAAVDPQQVGVHKPLTEWLADLGRDGFELVSVVPLLYSVGMIQEITLEGSLVYSLKRELSGPGIGQPFGGAAQGADNPG